MKKVAPLAGARIEILVTRPLIQGDGVAPLAGARIEIRKDREDGRGIWSLPLRERGLKSFRFGVNSNGE